MRVRTIGSLIEQVRGATDQERTFFVTDGEIQRQLAQGATAVHEMLVKVHPNWYLTSTNISTTAGTLGYSIPDDVNTIRGVDLLVDGTVTGRRVRLEPMNWDERAFGFGDEWQAATSTSLRAQRVRWWDQREGFGYGTGTGLLNFYPDPGTETYQLWYTRNPQDFSSAAVSSSFEGISGWEDYAVEHACVYVRRKADEDASPHLVAMQQMQARIESMAHRRDQSGPKRVSLTRRANRTRRGFGYGGGY